MMEVQKLVAKQAAPAPKPTEPEPDRRDQGAVWPMKLSQFMQGGWLEPADIVLSRKNGNFVSKLIRLVTKSHFSHSALVYVTPRFDPNYDNTFVIEAGTRGVDLANLARYVNDERSVSAVLRLNKAWFKDDVRGRVRGLVLNYIDAGYDYGIVLQILHNAWFRVKRSVEGHKRAVHGYTRKGRMAPTKFICSGFVQIGFIEAVAELVATGKLPRETLKEVVYTPAGLDALPKDLDALSAEELKAVLEEFQEDVQDFLEAVTPQDLAKSGNLEWRYVLRDGVAYRVTDAKEAQKLLYWKVKQPRLQNTPAQALS
ncbi:MAG: hypothetical protein F9K44_00680 [Hyphomicrobiaceae bacterium]|nr:MAG: hypothetical protein F9K44_00680 [Hyphomicrobiaceae bacterium]